MVFVRFLIWFSIVNSFYVLGADPKLPVLYAQDFCHYTTINHKIYVSEEHSSVIVKPSRGTYKPNLDCQLRIINRGNENSGLNININYINLRRFKKFKDYLMIKFGDKQTNLWYDKRLISNNREKEEFFFTENSYKSDEVVISFLTTVDNHDYPTNDKDFEIVITLFESKDSDSERKGDKRCDRKKWFDCGNNICIPRKLFCDGVNHCGNGWDEPNRCKHSRSNNYFDIFDNGFWFGFKIVVSLLLIGILLGIISCICKRYDENKKLRKQFLLDELNRHSGYRLNGNQIYSLNQNKTPLYPRLYRTYGGTDA